MPARPMARRCLPGGGFTPNRSRCRTARSGFYAKLREYLQDGFDLAKQQGNKGRALGFVMTIFQKIAASSFAAVRSTLRRRQLMLTIHEAILKDQALDIDGHLELLGQARRIIHAESNIADDAVGRGEVDRVLADLKYRLIKKLDDDELAAAASSESAEEVTAGGEELAAAAVSLSRFPRSGCGSRRSWRRFPAAAKPRPRSWSGDWAHCGA